MSHPAYKPPLRFVLRLRLQKGGAYLRDTMVQVTNKILPYPLAYTDFWRAAINRLAS